MMISVKYIFPFIALGLWLLPAAASAASLVKVDPATQHDISIIDNISPIQEYYGELKNSPHTFEFILKTDALFSAELQIPNGSKYQKSLIVIREEKRGVSEVGRVWYKEIDWQSDWNGRLGRTFLRAEPLTAQLNAGTYRIEVSSPENLGKYKLTLGSEQSWQGPVAYVSDSAAAAVFFAETPLGALRAPSVLATLLVLLLAGYFIRRRLKSKNHD